MENSKFLIDDYLNKNADMDIKDLRSKLYSEGCYLGLQRRWFNFTL